MEERLQKYLAAAGVASRRHAEELIAAGRVAVNGEVVRRMGVKVDPSRDEVRVDTVVVRPRGAAARPAPAPGARPGPDPAGIYLLMNKPAGFLCTASDDRGRKTVLDLVRVRGRIWPVGRLDEDSEGLLLLTDDGALTNLLTHPRYEVPKTYDLRIRGTVTPDDVRKVERGVWLSEGRSGPARMRVRRQGKDISHVEITLREGRNREVRRIFARLHHPVLSLRRTALGPLDLGGLKPGQVRRLDPREVRALFREALSPRGTGERPSEHLPPPRPSKGGARRGPPRGQRRGPPRDPRRAPARGERRAPPRGPRRAPRRGGG